MKKLLGFTAVLLAANFANADTSAPTSEEQSEERFYQTMKSKWEPLQSVDQIKKLGFEFETNETSNQTYECNGHKQLEIFGPFGALTGDKVELAITQESLRIPEHFAEFINNNGLSVAKYGTHLAINPPNGKGHLFYLTVSDSKVLMQEPDKDGLPGATVCLLNRIKPTGVSQAAAVSDKLSKPVGASIDASTPASETTESVSASSSSAK